VVVMKEIVVEVVKRTAVDNSNINSNSNRGCSSSSSKESSSKKKAAAATNNKQPWQPCPEAETDFEVFFFSHLFFFVLFLTSPPSSSTFSSPSLQPGKSGCRWWQLLLAHVFELPHRLLLCVGAAVRQVVGEGGGGGLVVFFCCC
jgi:hypothetical protein